MSENNLIKTRIVATLGPASSDAQSIESLLKAGVDVFRLNFSHGSLDEHTKLLQTVNEVRRRYPQETAVLGDLCGPKIRTGAIAPEGQVLNQGDEVIIRSGNEPGDAHHFGTNYERFVEDVQLGHRIMIDDGNIMLEAAEKNRDRLICRVIIGGEMFSHKGINLPNTQISIPGVTEKDWRCIDWALSHELNYLALSFVRTPEDVIQVKQYLHKHKSTIKVIAKIEKPQAVDCIENIINVSDAILIARGDMGVEMDLAQVPLIQKRITRLCRQYGRPVIVATQMLQSMIERPVPTRAEVSDVANAIFDLTDAVMLSGETAVGRNPLAAVQWIQRIAAQTEGFLDQHRGPRSRYYTAEEQKLTAVLSRCVAEVVDDSEAKFVVVWSQSGATARLLSKARIDVPIIALSSDANMCEQMNLHYGVIPVCQPVPEDIQAFARQAEQLLLDRKLAQVGDQIVLVAGATLGEVGTTNTIMIHSIAGAPI